MITCIMILPCQRPIHEDVRRFLPEHLRESYACGGVILFDGVCNLCDGTMHLVHRFDPGFFVYGQIQSEVNILISVQKNICGWHSRARRWACTTGERAG